MELERVSDLEQISPEDWEKTPASVKKLVEEMAQQMEHVTTCSDDCEKLKAA